MEKTLRLGITYEEPDNDLTWIKNEFQKLAGPDGQISEQDFKKLFQGVTIEHFIHRVFCIFDTDNSGSISISEYIETISQLLGAPDPDPKIQFLFKVYDTDGSGTLSKDEFKQVLMANIQESGFQFNPCQLRRVDALTDYFFFKADKARNKLITFDEFKAVMSSQPGLYEGVAQSVVNWISPRKSTPDTSKSSIFSSIKNVSQTVQNNALVSVWLAGLIFINFAFIFKEFVPLRANYLHFQNHNGNETKNDSLIWYTIGRGTGQSLNFQCTFLIIPTLVCSMTFLKMHGASKYFPIENRLLIHGSTGVVIVILSFIHGTCHLLNIQYGLVNSPINKDDCFGDQIYGYVDFLVGSTFGKYEFISGIVLMGILIVLVAFSNDFVRKSSYFEVFYWTHLLYIPFFAILLFFHGPNFWKWFIVPGTLLIIEKIYRYKRTKLFDTIDAEILPSNVIKLIIRRPIDFVYSPGDYVFICVPSVSNHEFYPFVLSSCPEIKEELWIHIFLSGGWSRKLHTQIKEWINQKEDVVPGASETSVCVSPSDEEKTPFIVDEKSTKRPVQKIFIDGPYTAPVSAIFNAEHAILIGTGKGVFPFASVLQSASKRFWASKMITCPHCRKGFESEDLKLCTVSRLRKIDFIWLNRNQLNFQWFVSLLAQLETEQIEKLKNMEVQEAEGNRFLDMHLYLTSASKPTDMKTFGLTLAMSIIEDRKQKDYLTGLKTRTHAGRPDFAKLFHEIQESNQKGQITVFYSGSSKLGQLIKENCKKFGFEFNRQYF